MDPNVQSTKSVSILSILFSKLTISQRQTIFFYRRKIILNKQFMFLKERNVNE